MADGALRCKAAGSSQRTTAVGRNKNWRNQRTVVDGSRAHTPIGLSSEGPRALDRGERAEIADEGALLGSLIPGADHCKAEIVHMETK